MLKILGRTFIILLAAVFIADGIYFYTKYGMINILNISPIPAGDEFPGKGKVMDPGEMPPPPNQGNLDGDLPDLNGEFPQGAERGNRERGFSLRALAQLGSQGGKIAAITLVVSLVKMAVRAIKKRRSQPIFSAKV